MPLDERPAGQRPYLWLDATYVKVRQNGRVVPLVGIVAVGVNGDGRRLVAAFIATAFAQNDAEAAKAQGRPRRA